MKRIKLIVTVFIMAIALSAFMLLKEKEKTIVFFGDSITYAGAQPNGYIDLMKQVLEKKGKEDQFNLIGEGISGNKVPDLQKRLESDVLEHNPDLVFIYIGINDVWHASYDPPSGTPIAAYESGLKDMIKKIKAAGAEVVLCTPTVIGEKKNGENPQDAALDKYAAISREVAKEMNVQLCDLRKLFIKYLKKHNKENKEKGVLTIDGVHLNDVGNKLVADKMMEYL